MAVTVVRNGHVVDIHNGIDDVADVYIEDGRISKIRIHSDEDRCVVKEDIGDSNGGIVEKCVDASGCVVTAGLVDFHVHAYQHATPLGIDLDTTCLARGVTTVVDAGSSGSSTFAGLRHLIGDHCKTRLYAFLHIAKHGLASAACAGLSTGGECDSLHVVSPDSCHDVIQQNKDVIVGVKVRLAASVADEGTNEQEILRRSLDAAKRGDVPLMVHHALSTVPHEEVGEVLGCPGSLRRGDVYTHCFHGHQSNVLDPTSGRVVKACWEAKQRGVVFDVGHGQGSFSWHVAKQCVSEGFWPDTISTDLHTESQNGPAYDLLCIMTKMMHLGMPLNDVIAAVTCRPAAVIGKLDEIGHLGVGMRADVTILKLVDLSSPVDLEDSFGETCAIGKSMEVAAVFLGGQQQPVFTFRQWPNPRTVQECRARSDKYRAKTLDENK